MSAVRCSRLIQVSVIAVLLAACAGFVYGLHAANGLVSSGLHRRVLVVAGETLTKVTDFTDRTTCILFGDGAGAARGSMPRFLTAIARR